MMVGPAEERTENQVNEIIRRGHTWSFLEKRPGVHLMWISKTTLIKLEMGEGGCKDKRLKPG